MRKFRSLILIASLVAAPGLHANDSQFAYARVIAAEPINVSERVAVRKQVCAKPPVVSPPGDARRDRPQSTIGDLIRADTRQRRPDCQNVTEFEEREKTVGWRVSYRYDGNDYVQRMKTRPGQRIRVRVASDAR